jgi:hypothetical protein
VKRRAMIKKALKLNGVFGERNEVGAYRITHLQPGRPGRLTHVKMG